MTRGSLSGAVLAELRFLHQAALIKEHGSVKVAMMIWIPVGDDLPLEVVAKALEASPLSSVMTSLRWTVRQSERLRWRIVDDLFAKEGVLPVSRARVCLQLCPEEVAGCAKLAMRREVLVAVVGGGHLHRSGIEFFSHPAVFLMAAAGFPKETHVPELATSLWFCCFGERERRRIAEAVAAKPAWVFFIEDPLLKVAVMVR